MTEQRTDREPAAQAALDMRLYREPGTTAVVTGRACPGGEQPSALAARP